MVAGCSSTGMLLHQLLLLRSLLLLLLVVAVVLLGCLAGATWPMNCSWRLEFAAKLCWLAWTWNGAVSVHHWICVT
jgi:hypothetical protein